MRPERTFDELVGMIDDPAGERALYDCVQELRSRLDPSLVTCVDAKSQEMAFGRAWLVIRVVLRRIFGVRPEAQGDPGHGRGHWERDNLHSFYLCADPTLDPKIILPSVIAGTLHDIGTVFVDRYADKNRAVRHAEIGALLVHASAIESGLLSPREADLVAWAIAAHTHYLKPSSVKCRDGATRVVEPFPEMDGEEPVMPIWLTRFADRLDCSGPCMVGRHYLTLVRDHDDFGAGDFYRVKYANHMRPANRSEEEIKAGGGTRTMLEHLRMFARSQTNASVYGRYDRGRMVPLRDRYRASLEHILDQVEHPTDIDPERMSERWLLFLNTCIEPTASGASAASKLHDEFLALERETQIAWANGFRAAMAEYLVFADRLLHFVQTSGIEDLLSFDLTMISVRPDSGWCLPR